MNRRAPGNVWREGSSRLATIAASKPQIRSPRFIAVLFVSAIVPVFLVVVRGWRTLTCIVALQANPAHWKVRCCRATHITRSSDRKLQLSSTYTDRSPGFRAELGFVPRTDIREFKNRIGYKWWREKGALVNFGPAVTVLRNWNRRGQTQDWQVEAEWYMEFMRLTGLTVKRTEAFELYDNQRFRKGFNSYSLNTEWFKWLALQSGYTHGDAVNYYSATGTPPALGSSKSANVGVTLRPTPRLRLDETYLYGQLKTRSGLVTAANGTTIYNNHILRSKANYQFTRELSIRAILDYNGVLPNTSLVSLEPSKRISYDLLATYLLHPGTALYVGYTDGYENLRIDPSRPPHLQRSGAPDMNTGRQVFVKMSYLLRF